MATHIVYLYWILAKTHVFNSASVDCYYKNMNANFHALPSLRAETIHCFNVHFF